MARVVIVARSSMSRVGRSTCRDGRPHTAYRATKVLRASSITIPASTTADASPVSPTSSVAARQTSPENAATSASPPGFHASTAFCVRLFRPFVFNCSLYCNPTPAGYNVRVRSLCVLQCGSRVVSVLDSGAEGPGFKSQPRRRRVKAKFHYTDPTGPARTQRSFAAKKVRAGPVGSVSGPCSGI